VLPYSFQDSAIRLGFACVCPKSVEYTPCFLLLSSYTPQSFLCADYSGVSSSQINDIIHLFLISPSHRNLGTRFLLRERVVPCVTESLINLVDKLKINFHRLDVKI
jgi:hypothetical protein